MTRQQNPIVKFETGGLDRMALKRATSTIGGETLKGRDLPWSHALLALRLPEKPYFMAENPHFLFCWAPRISSFDMRLLVGAKENVS